MAGGVVARVKQQNGGRVMAKQDDLRHEGVHAQRVRSDHNKLEAVLARRWREQQARVRGLNRGLGVLENLMTPVGQDPEPITQRDAAVAATVVQWMGSPIGQAFMDECREEAEGLRR